MAANAPTYHTAAYQSSWNGRVFQMNFEFQNVEESLNFFTHVETIKSFIATLNWFHDTSQISDEQYDHRVREWLVACHEFSERWGATYVPLDIRRSVIEIQENLDIDQTVYPIPTNVVYH